jgi:hypothetical protein
MEHFRWHQAEKLSLIPDENIAICQDAECDAAAGGSRQVIGENSYAAATVPKRMILAFGSGKNVRGFSLSAAK